MATYVITGVSKGIGWGFLDNISKDPENLIVGLVRDKEATEKKVKEQLSGRSNVHILHADLTNYDSLKQAAVDTEPIVGGRGIDFLVANGAFPSQFDAYDPIGKLGENVEELEEVASKSFKTNVVGNIHFFNLFVPLVKKSKVKKCIAISSGHGDLDWINNVDIETASIYAASKAALNVIVAKFSVQYKKEGILFFSISPGAVEVGHFDNVPQEKMEGLISFMSKIQAYAPWFTGSTPVDDAVALIRGLWERASIESGYAGAFVSQYGNKQYM